MVLAIPPLWASSNNALMRANNKPPVELVVADYLYINQKPMGGNVRSSVATCMGVADSISKLFSKKYKLNKTVFSNLSTAEGMCPTCSGTGIITYGSDSQSQIVL